MTTTIGRYFAALGARGGKARAASMTPRQLKAAARKAAKARWAKRDAETDTSDTASDFTTDEQRRIAEARRNGRAGVVKVKRGEKRV